MPMPARRKKLSTNVSSNNCFPKFANRKLTIIVFVTFFLSLFFHFSSSVLNRDILFPVIQQFKLLFFQPFCIYISIHNRSQKIKGENKCSHIKFFDTDFVQLIFFSSLCCCFSRFILLFGKQ